MKWVAGFFIGSLVLAVPATTRGFCIGRQRVVVNKVVVNEIVTPAFVTVPVVVPLYGAAYVPAPQVVAAPAAASGYNGVATQGAVSAKTDTQLILERLDNMQRQIDTLAGGKAAAAPREAHPGLLVLNNKCSSCHDAARPAPNAPPFLEDGGLIKTADSALLSNIMLDLFDESMPKKGEKLTQEEHAQVLDYFKTLRVKPGAKQEMPPPAPDPVKPKPKEATPPPKPVEPKPVEKPK